MHFQCLALVSDLAGESLVIEPDEVRVHAAQDGPNRTRQQKRRAGNVGRDRAACIPGRRPAKLYASSGGARRIDGCFDGLAERCLNLRAAVAASLHIRGIGFTIVRGKF